MTNIAIGDILCKDVCTHLKQSFKNLEDCTLCISSRFLKAEKEDMQKMKLYYKIWVSDNLNKLFENPNTKLGEGWEIFLSLDGEQIDVWISNHKNEIQRYGNVMADCERKYPNSLSNDEMHKIVYFAIQVYAFQKGLDMYLQDPERRKLDDDIYMSMAQIGFVDEALEFCKKNFLGFIYTKK